MTSFCFIEKMYKMVYNTNVTKKQYYYNLVKCMLQFGK